MSAINWSLSLELCGGSPETAEELLMMLAEELPEFKEKIQATYEAKDAKNLSFHAHKLHGACCYCGVPRLKPLIKNLEAHAKSMPPIFDDALFNEVMAEISMIEHSLRDQDYK